MQSIAATGFTKGFDMSLYIAAQEGNVARLRDALASEKIAIRQRATELLGEHADPEDTATVDALLQQAMNDEDGNVREAGVAALDALGPEALDRLVAEHAFDRDPGDRELSVKACARVLKSERAELRLAAVHALERLGDSSGVPLVVRALGDDDARVRRRACSAAGALESEQLVQPLTERLEDGRGVRRAAIIALGRIGTKPACQQLVSLLSADDPIVRRDVTRALGIARYTPAINGLLSRVDDPNSEVSGAAFRAVMEVLPDLPSDTVEDIRKELLNRLEQQPSRAANDLLLTLTREGRRSGIRVQAIWLLGNLSTRDDNVIIEAMIGALETGEDVVKDAARQQLVEMSPTRVRYQLFDLLQRNPPGRTRAAIAWILGHHGGDGVHDRLEQLSDDEDPDVRKQAHTALERLGGDTE